MTIKELNGKEYETFINKYGYKDYRQSISYAAYLKSKGYNIKLLGFIENGEIKASLLLAYNIIFLRYYGGFSPRGLVTRYSDINLLNRVLKSLKEYLNRNKFITFKIDPPCIIFVRNKKGIKYQSDKAAKDIYKTFIDNGFKHKGMNKYFNTMNPRFEALLNLDKTQDILFRDLRKNVRNKLRKATKYGLVVYKDNEYDWKTYYNILKGINNINLKDYLRLNKAFGTNLEVYYAKLNTVTYVENSRRLYEKELSNNSHLNNIIQSSAYKGKDMTVILNKKMQSDKVLSSYKIYMTNATNLLKKYPNGFIVGVSVIIKYKDTIYLFNENYDKNFSNLCANYLTKWKIIEKYAGNKDINYFNLGAISGEFDKKKNPYKGLNEMKLGYNSKVIEYLGEFEIITNENIYKLYNTFGRKN